jgi:hypothetical protein
LFERRYSRFDLATNIIAYVPLGFLFAMCFFPRLRAIGGIFAALLCGALLSVAVEVAQVYLPGRVSSRVDLLANAVGSAIGALAALSVSHTTLMRRMREAWFIAGGWGDAGIALLALFAISSAKPTLPLMGNLAPNASTLSVVINAMLNCIAVGLFVAVIARSRERTPPLLASGIAALVSLKLLAAWLLFRNSASGLSVEAMMGVGYGVAALALILWRTQNVLPYCVAALVCALAFTQWHALAFPYVRSDDEQRYQEVTRLIAEWWALTALFHLALRPATLRKL